MAISKVSLPLKRQLEAINPPPGCHFHPRCRYAEDRCMDAENPVPVYEVGDGHRVQCILAEEHGGKVVEERPPQTATVEV
jgi:ABC-type dipeptide/oligopeptide/nickel transport system ATPase component